MTVLFLAGDVMTARGIDQILPHPCAPQIFEDHMTSALDYVALAENAHGKIFRRAGFAYVWGDALDELSVRPDRQSRDSRHQERSCRAKGHPANIPVLTAAGIDCCVLSNNHVLDWGEAGLLDTLIEVRGAGILTAGAGRDFAEACRPAIVKVSERCRVLVFGLGLESSGIPYHWAAGANRPGVRLLADLSRETSLAFASEVLKQKRTGDIAVISIHWGSNWGHHITPAQVDFAHALIDLGACDVLHGHSSHHARAIEIYRGKLILYGCGDFINDYEGIEGHKKYGGDLAVMYLPEVNEADGSLAALSLVLFQVRGFRLRRASLSDTRSFQSVLERNSLSKVGAAKLCNLFHSQRVGRKSGDELNRHSQKFATRLLLDGDGNLAVVPIF